jgi:hypothetical protein
LGASMACTSCVIPVFMSSVVMVNFASFTNYKVHKACSKYEYHVSNKIMKYHTPLKLVKQI